ncbi:protein DOG1-like 4 [Ananas comosus]|uniref:Protein DOG1-like 4 n=1 Tax=Ananas comosus TaxID=4615 RepID=A0A6P5EXG0_ANACO|nr:protein DOG1-like 4 [Ananas comosus]XP_020085832.1 protein DOG1-like 4 [Ananas comosus]XP_020085833.1 protein DOG1-like 4 [Ananas comosus]XP_020085834.1 protein DOG1-like 4 [Ananas comosus]XP_020085835.1 protein DOG1-like 4 [Ananas comosus]
MSFLSSSNSRSYSGVGEARNGQRRSECFARFYENWLAEQERDLADLRSAAAAAAARGGGEEEEDGGGRRPLQNLVDRVVGHYEYYYRAKAASARRDVLPMFSPTWTSSTENLFTWVGGWRPSTAIQLLYSKSGLQLEARLSNIIRALPSPDLAGLSPAQLERVDRLHRRTVRREREIAEDEAAVQEAVAEARMLEIAQAMRGSEGTEAAVGEMRGQMSGKEEGMERVLEMADELRVETIKGLVEILEPIQAVHFLIAAAELQLAVRQFGMRKDAEAAASVANGEREPHLTTVIRPAT